MKVAVVDADFERPAHRTALVEILDSYATDPVGGGEPLSHAVRERLVPALRRHPGLCALLAQTEERAVGLAVCFLAFSTFRARPVLNVHDLAVLPEWRGRGIGRALLAAVEERARERGCCKITLEVQDDNARARTLYERFGFSDFVVAGSGPTRFLSKTLE